MSVPPTPVTPPMVFYLVPLAPMQVPPAPVVPPMAPPTLFGQAYPPGGWAPIPNYAPAPAQPYPISYPPPQWPQYLPYNAANRALLTKILKLPHLTSSLVRTPQSY